MLYRSQLVYCSEIWKPCYRKDVERLGQSTKFILNDYKIDYKERLTKLNLLATTNVHVRPERCNVLCKEFERAFNIREYISANKIGPA